MRLPLFAIAALSLLTAAGEAPIAPDKLKADLRFAVETIARNHPDLAHSVDRAALDAAAARIERQLDRPMTRTEAWRVLAQLNPLLADGHLLIGFADWRGDAAAARAAGFFPYEVAVSEDGAVRIAAALGGAPTPLAGKRVTRINGRDAGEVVRELLARMHGDTPRFRAALLGQRWWLYHWKLFGAPAAYDLEIEGRPLRVAASTELPALLQREASFDRTYGCELLPGGAALLSVGAFSWPDKAPFFAFTHDCFAKMKAAGTKRLVIDVRANGGGDDDMWRDGILRYIATRPYRHGSRYTKRVLKDRPEAGEAAGQIVEAEISTETLPPADEPLRFGGDVTVLIGPLSYSSTVLFANTVQDHRFASVAGVGGAVRSTQSGGVQVAKLPHSGLMLSFPRFVLTRPSGTAEPKLLTPDAPLADDPLAPRAMVDAVLARRTPSHALTSVQIR